MIPLNYVSSKHDSPGRWRRPVIIGLIAAGAGAVVLVIAAVVLVALMPPMMGTDTESVSVQQIEQIGAVRLPSGITNLKTHLQSWQDFSLEVRFSIRPGQLDELIDGVQIPRPLSTTEIPPHLLSPQSPAWWNPGKPTMFEAGSNEPGNNAGAPTTQPHIYRYLLIDKSRPDQYVVWLLMFDT